MRSSPWLKLDEIWIGFGAWSTTEDVWDVWAKDACLREWYSFGKVVKRIRFHLSKRQHTVSVSISSLGFLSCVSGPALDSSSPGSDGALVG